MGIMERGAEATEFRPAKRSNLGTENAGGRTVSVPVLLRPEKRKNERRTGGMIDAAIFDMDGLMLRDIVPLLETLRAGEGSP